MFACECPDYEPCKPHYCGGMHTVPSNCSKKSDGTCKKFCECK